MFFVWVVKLFSWRDEKTLIPFLNKVAHGKGFHPTLQYERWYNINLTELAQYKVLVLFRGVLTIVRVAGAEKAVGCPNSLWQLFRS